jgi:simple sugar transport system ATP-binding protein
VTTTETTTATTPLIEVQGIGKNYGSVIALRDVSTVVNPGEVTCVLGDNGAGKSTLIKVLAGVHQHDAGRFLVDGEEVRFASPRDALERGIATVYQDLAVVPLMSVWRNFFLGSEPTVGAGPLQRLDRREGREIARTALADMGIDRGFGVVFITHNPHHAFPVGNRFLILKRGRSLGSTEKSEITIEELTRQMSGGAELEALEHELREVTTP